MLACAWVAGLSACAPYAPPLPVESAGSFAHDAAGNVPCQEDEIQLIGRPITHPDDGRAAWTARCHKQNYSCKRGVFETDGRRLFETRCVNETSGANEGNGAVEALGQATRQNTPEETPPRPMPAKLRSIADGFDRAAWGSSLQQVRAAYPHATWTEGDSRLTFHSKILGEPAATVFLFVEDQLVQASVAIEAKHSDKNTFINDFRKLEDALQEKYGEPDDDYHTLWQSYLAPSDSQELGIAVSIGSLMIISRWIGADTEIEHVLNGGNNSIEHTVTCHSVAHEALRKAHGL